MICKVLVSGQIERKHMQTNNQTTKNCLSPQFQDYRGWYGEVETFPAAYGPQGGRPDATSNLWVVVVRGLIDGEYEIKIEAVAAMKVLLVDHMYRSVELVKQSYDGRNLIDEDWSEWALNEDTGEVELA